jgi:hypothetical protein
MIKHPLYLLMESADPKHATLELRTNLDPLRSYRFERSAQGQYVLHVPEPVIPVASGTLEDILLVADRLFGISPDAEWQYLGDRVHAYTLQVAEKRS